MRAKPPPQGWGFSRTAIYFSTKKLRFARVFRTVIHKNDVFGTEARIKPLCQSQSDLILYLTGATALDRNEIIHHCLQSKMSDEDKRDDGSSTGVIVKAKPKTKKPAMYKVLMLNDDYTPMEFVVHVLERFFQKNRDEATRIMLHVHQRGVGICGVFTYEVAETKVTQVMDFARRHQHPLQCTLEKD
jgi:ATP-dependent Clp protease adaptor protein ClpS